MKNKLFLFVLLLSYPALQAMGPKAASQEDYEAAALEAGNSQASSGSSAACAVRMMTVGQAIDRIARNLSLSGSQTGEVTRRVKLCAGGRAILDEEVVAEIEEGFKREFGLDENQVEHESKAEKSSTLDEAQEEAYVKSAMQHLLKGSTTSVDALHYMMHWLTSYESLPKEHHLLLSANRKLVKALIEAGAPIDVKNRVGENAIFLAFNASLASLSACNALETRQENYRWFKNMVCPILLAAGRTRELEALDSSRQLPEEAARFKEHVREVLMPEIPAVIGAIVGEYAARPIESCKCVSPLCEHRSE